jgi:glycerol-3-phosphate dehydrogenase (NAD(P)+)
MRVAIIGGGGWGLALSNLLAENGHSVTVWEHDKRYLASLISLHSNPWLLKGVYLPESVSYTGSFEELASLLPEIVILATPSQYLRLVLRSIPLDAQRKLWESNNLIAIVNVAKGIEEQSLKLMSDVLHDELPEIARSRICALSGPSHAEEVARRIPTTVVVAGTDETLLSELQMVFSNSYFRVYRSSDIIGVELGGAVKNVIAIAAGIIAGLNFGDNTIGALLTRGLVEIQRFGMSFGAKAETFLGLSGVGDLITTATSQHSRNRYVGFEIGSGRKLKEIMAEMDMVAEGVVTTSSVYQLASRQGIEMPITEQVYRILYEDKDPRKAIIELMTRELKSE